MTKPITDKQIDFARRLLGERLVTLGLPDVETAVQVTDLVNMTTQQARTLIDRLLNEVAKDPDPTMPEVVANATRYGKGNRPGFCYTCRAVVDTNAGWYFLDGGGKWSVHHNVGQCIDRTVAEVQPQGIDISTVPDGKYADPLGESRLKVKVTHGTGKWAGTIFVNDAAVYGFNGRLGRQTPDSLYVGKAMDTVERIVADPLAAMAAYGHLTSTCGKCGRPLEDEESVARGIGPVCYQRMAG